MSKTTHTIAGLFALIALALTGCGSETRSQQKFDALVTKHNELKNQVDALLLQVNSLQGELDDNVALYLGRMDRDLDAIQDGREPKGSYSDYFIINAEKAVRAGATRKEIENRIDRLIVLVVMGKYMHETEALTIDAKGTRNGPTMKKNIMDALFPLTGEISHQ